MSQSTFKGSIQVRSTDTGFAVKMEGATDAHDLGHALAAVVVKYVDEVRKVYPGADREEMWKAVFDGIACGLSHNPEPVRKLDG